MLYRDDLTKGMVSLLGDKPNLDHVTRCSTRDKDGEAVHISYPMPPVGLSCNSDSPARQL